MKSKTENWHGISENYFKLIKESSEGNINIRIPNPSFYHAQLSVFTLIKRAKKSIKIFTGSLSKNIYDNKNVKEAINNLSDNIKIEIVLESEKDSNSFDSKKNKVIMKLNNNEKAIKDLPGHFMLIDNQSYRFEKYGKNRLVDNSAGITNFNDVEFANIMNNVFDKLLIKKK